MEFQQSNLNNGSVDIQKDQIPENLRKLTTAHTRCGEIITKHWGMSLREYLASLIPKGDPYYQQDNRYRDMVTEALGDQVTLYGYPRRSEILKQFMEEPVLQMADGAHLLYDAEVFLNNFLHQIAARERNQKFLISQQCSTIRALMYPEQLYGPAFLHLDVDVLNVFGLSKKKLTYANMASLREVQFVFEPTGTKVPVYTKIQLPDPLESLRGQSFARASEAIRCANTQIWNSLKMRAKKPLIQFTEDLSARVWSIAIKQGNNALHALLFKPAVRSSFLRMKKAMLQSSENLILQDSSDFFHYRKNNQLKSARLVEQGGQPVLCDATQGVILQIPFNEISIADALDRGDLFPDLIMSYIALSVLPQVVALGGASQQEYLPVITKIILRTHEEVAFLSSSEHDQLIGSNTSRLSGGALLTLTASQSRAIGLMNSHTDLDSFESEIINTTIGPSFGNFNYFNYFNLFYERKGLSV